VITAFDITLAQPADALAIATLSREAIEYGLPWRWMPGRVMKCIRDASTNVVVARRDGELIGFAIMKYGEDEAHVLLFAVRAAQRCGGLGSALLAWLEATAGVAGIRTIRLEARAGNAAARAFYRRHGFEETGLSPRYYEDAEDGVRMVKRLGVES
jgi:ribosomal-protein-alanine N-acetyltransferase